MIRITLTLALIGFGILGAILFYTSYPAISCLFLVTVVACLAFTIGDIIQFVRGK